MGGQSIDMPAAWNIELTADVGASLGAQPLPPQVMVELALPGAGLRARLCVVLRFNMDQYGIVQPIEHGVMIGIA